MWGVFLVRGFRASRRMQSKVLRSLSWGGVFCILGFLVGAMFQNYYGTFINCLEWWFVVGVLITSEKLDIHLQSEGKLAHNQ
jgi:hypothetical protein